MITKHCFICCLGKTTRSCIDTAEWGPSSWGDGENVSQVLKHMNLLGHNVNFDMECSDVCESHYLMIRKVLLSHKCVSVVLCKCLDSPSRSLGVDLNMQQIDLDIESND